MKISKEEFETFAKFITIMKKYEPQGNQWSVSVGGDVVHNPDDLSFNRFIYVNGNVIELEKIYHE